MSEWEQLGERLRDRAAYTQGVKDTEERFIELLEAKRCTYSTCSRVECRTYDELIEELKGEQSRREAIQELKRISREIGEVD